MESKSDINEIRRELARLKIAHEALLQSHRDLALKTLGDTPQTGVFLEQIQAFETEHYPEWMKS